MELYAVNKITPNLHAVYVNPCSHSELLSNQPQFGNAVQQPVIELQREMSKVKSAWFTKIFTKRKTFWGMIYVMYVCLWLTRMRYLSCDVPFLADSFRMCPSLMSSLVGLTMSSSPPSNSYTFNSFLMRSWGTKHLSFHSSNGQIAPTNISYFWYSCTYIY